MNSSTKQTNTTRCFKDFDQLRSSARAACCAEFVELRLQLSHLVGMRSRPGCFVRRGRRSDGRVAAPGALPVSVFVLVFTCGPLAGSMYFHEPAQGQPAGSLLDQHDRALW